MSDYRVGIEATLNLTKTMKMPFCKTTINLLIVKKLETF